MSMTYYFISDLHIGGDEALGVCDYEAELIAFLEKLATPAGRRRTPDYRRYLWPLGVHRHRGPGEA